MWEYEYHEDTAKIASEDDLQQYDKKNHYTHPEYYFTIKIGERIREDFICCWRLWFGH